MDDKKYLLSLIREGEHQQQDFKYRVADACKLAKSVSAFANTDGGRLLIGVRDDGLSQTDGAVATNSGKSLRNSCFFPKTALTLHRRKETNDTTNNIV